MSRAKDDKLRQDEAANFVKYYGVNLRVMGRDYALQWMVEHIGSLYAEIQILRRQVAVLKRANTIRKKKGLLK